MTTLKKNDIENYEDTLWALANSGGPPRPQSEQDGEVKAYGFWADSELPNAEKVHRLIRDMFGTKAALAKKLGCSDQRVRRILAGEVPGDTLDWDDDGPDSPGDRLVAVFACWEMLKILSGYNGRYLTPDRAVRLGLRVDQLPELQEVVTRAFKTPSGWSWKVADMLGEMMCLCENDYPPEPPADVPE